METITSAAKRQEESNKKMTEVAEKISKLFEEAMQMLDRLAGVRPAVADQAVAVRQPKLGGDFRNGF